MKIFAFLGTEEARKYEVLNQYLQKDSFEKHELHRYHAGSVNCSEVESLLLSPPLFDRVLPILITDVDCLSLKEQKYIASVCMRGKDNHLSNLLFLFSKKNKLSAVLANAVPKSQQKVFYELNEDEKKQYIVDLIHKNHKQIDLSAVNILLERISHDISTIEQILETVYLYMPESETMISEELLEQIFTHSSGQTVLELFHHMVGRKLYQSLLVVESLLQQGNKASSVLIQLLYPWSRLLTVKERISHTSASLASVAVEEYYSHGTRRDLELGIKNYSLRDLQSIQKMNLEYNVDLKLSTGIQNQLLKVYIYKVVHQYQE